MRVEYDAKAARDRSRSQSRRCDRAEARASERHHAAAEAARRRGRRRSTSVREASTREYGRCRSSTTTRWRCTPRTVMWTGRRHAHDLRQDPGRRRTARNTSAACSAMPKDEVRVLSPYVGGAFGSGLRPQYQLFLAVLAALELKRSVRVVADAAADVHLRPSADDASARALGAAARRRAAGAPPRGDRETSRFEDYQENVVNWSGMLYRCENVEARLQARAARRLHAAATCARRAAPPGLYALECAMDELAYARGRRPAGAAPRKNYTERDQNEDKPFSSKELRAVLHAAAPSASAGRGAAARRARCARAASSSAGAWRRASGKPYYDKRVGEGDAHRGRPARSVLGDLRHRHGHVHDHDADRRRNPGPAARARDVQARRLDAAGSADRRRLVDGGVGRLRREARMRRHRAAGADARARDGRSPLAGATTDDVEFADGWLALRSDASARVSIDDVLRASGTESLERHRRRIAAREAEGLFARIRTRRCSSK